MKDDEYGVKLSMDLTEFKKGASEAKKELQDLEGTRKVKVTGGDGDYTLNLRKGLEKTTEAFENLASAKERIETGQIKITGLEETQQDIAEVTRRWEEYRQQTAGPIQPTMKTVFDESEVIQGLENTKAKVNEVSSTISSKLQDRIDAVADNIKTKLSNAFSLDNIKIQMTGVLDKIKNKMKDVKKSADQTGNSVKSAFDKGVGSLKKFALGLFGVQTAYRAVTKAVSSYLSYDQQLSNSIQSTWAGLGSFLAPVLEYLVGVFQKLLGYINAVVTALTGINFVARANAKAMANAGKSASSAGKQAQKALAPFDELNNINQDTGSSGGGGGGAETPQIQLPEIDQAFVDKILAGLQKVREFMNTIFDPIRKAWDEKGEGVIKSIRYAFESLAKLGEDVGKSILKVWTNGTGQKTMELIFSLWTSIFNIIGNVATAIDNAWNKNNNGLTIIQDIFDIYNDILTIVNDIAKSLKKWTMSESFQSAIDVIMGIIRDLFDFLKGIADWLVSFYETYLSPLVDSVLGFISRVVEIIGILWNFLKPIFTAIVKWIASIIGPAIGHIVIIIQGIIDVLNGVMDFIIGVFTGNWDRAWNGIKGIFEAIWNTIKRVFENAINWIVGIFTTAVENIKNIWKNITKTFETVWNTLKTGAKKAWDGIKSIFSGVAKFFGDVFSTAWKKVKDVFSTGGKIFDGIKEGIVSAFKTVVNAIITGINKVVAIPFKAINTVLKGIRDIDILGQKPFKGLIHTIDIPQIPKLKVGTDNVYEEGLAYLHKGEKVVPANVAQGGYSGSDNEETNSLLRELIEAVNDKDYNPYITVDDIGKASVNYIRKKSRIEGEAIL